MAMRRLIMTEAGRGQVHANVVPGAEFECSDGEAAVHLALGYATEARPFRPDYSQATPRPRGRPPRIPRVEQTQDEQPHVYRGPTSEVAPASEPEQPAEPERATDQPEASSDGTYERRDLRAEE